MAAASGLGTGRRRTLRERIRDAMPEGVVGAVHHFRYAQHQRRKRAYLDAQRQGSGDWGRWAFIHINKCGGTSVEEALNLPTKIHDTALERRAAVGAARWEAMPSFALVRHPYDRLCSHYRYIIRTNRKSMRQGVIGLNDWIAKVLDEKDPFYVGDPRMVMPCHDWIADEDGRIIVDLVGKLETLETDWPRIQALTGITAVLPVSNRTDARNGAVADLSPASRALIGQAFARDFEVFGYDP